MACKSLFAALIIVAAASPAGAQPEMNGPAVEEGAPQAPPDARYCLKVDPVIGSRIETVLCETREQWAMLDVDLDKEWAKEGVRVLPPAGPNS